MTWKHQFPFIFLKLTIRLPSGFYLQEPGNETQIKQFAQGYDAQFDMFSKTEVNGENAHPLWKWMKEQPNGKGTFGKYVDKKKILQ